jgi:hypothetical protein
MLVRKLEMLYYFRHQAGTTGGGTDVMKQAQAGAKHVRIERVGS